MEIRPEYCHIGEMTTSASWTAPRHAHPFLEMIAVVAGRMRIALDDRVLELGTGDLALYPVGSAHAESAAGGKGVEFRFLSLRAPNVLDLPLTQHDSEGRVAILSSWMIQDRHSSYAERQVLLDHLAGLVLEEYRRLAMHRPDDPVERVRLHLRRHPEASHTVVALARLAGMSRFHFIRRYRRQTGRTPMADCREIRLGAASDLLLATDLPLKAIADKVGFCDEYYLSRVFAAKHGMPPGRFRRQSSGGR